MFSDEKKINRIFLYWLITSLLLVFFIIIVGGLTRLTDSGLSITKWELFRGILPPLNDKSWLFYFDQYKKIPQYRLLNSNMTINEFKIIFYWEYFHRLLARFIGLFFLIPLIFFYFTKKIKSDYIYTCSLIFLIIVFQGIVGWYMVESGLIDDVTVSHYRLSIHLSTAIIIISSLFWLILNITLKKNIVFFELSKTSIPFILLLVLIYFQIILGAFVSGLDAGRIYQTWPMMGSTLFPDDLSSSDLLSFNNHSLVQFYHRNLAYLITLYVFLMTFFIYKKKIIRLYRPLKIFLFFLLLQVLLGIFTLVGGLNIYLASSHQITSILLVFSALNLYYLRTK